MTDKERIERLENKLKEALSWWRATEKQLLQKCKETKTNQKTIERLKSENAELRARLEKAVELPCKIGDTVYEVHDKCDGRDCPFNGYYGQWRCRYEGKKRCEPFISTERFWYNHIQRINKTIFVSKEAAEAKLKELKENKQ